MQRAIRAINLVLAFCIPVAALAAEAEYPPSGEAQKMAGALGTFAFKPDDWPGVPPTWWKDTDGVKPGVPGCHVGLDKVGEDSYKPNGRMFGEACTTERVLVESNPEAGKVHAHANDVGHPDLFDCHAWCIGEGSSGGVCQAATAEPCGASARCACSR